MCPRCKQLCWRLIVFDIEDETYEWCDSCYAEYELYLVSAKGCGH